MSQPSVIWQARAKASFARLARDETIAQAQNYMKNSGIRLERTDNEETGLKHLELVTDLLPIEIPLSVGLALHSLRSALDTAVSTLMANAGAQGASRIGFPMHETEEGLRASFEDGSRTCPNHRCGHVTTRKGAHAEIRQRLPDFEALLFDEFRPWRDGNYALWALGKLDNIDKHRMIIPTLGRTSWKGSWHAASLGGGMHRSTNCTYIQPPGMRTNLMTTNGSIVIDDPGVFATELVFSEDIPLGRVPVVQVLEDLMHAVDSILDTLEAKFTP